MKEQEVLTPDVESGRAERTWIRQLVLPTLLFAILALVFAGPHFAVQDEQYRSEIFLHLFATQEVPGAVLMIVMLALASLLAGKVGHRTIVRGMAAAVRRPHIVLPGVLLLLILATGSVYHRHPLALDEYAPSYQATTFAEGEVFGFVPPPLIARMVPSFFINRFWLYSPSTGRLASAYWPGHALLMAPFAKLGVPWLLNPLLAVGFLALLAKLAGRVFDHPLAPGWAVILALASPDFIVNAISYYSMTAHLFFNLVFIYLLLEPTRGRLFAAGLVGSLSLTLHNPVPHFFVALPWILSFAWRKERFRLLVPLFLGYLPLTVVLGAGWLYLRAVFQAEWNTALLAKVPAFTPLLEEDGGSGLEHFFALVTKFSSELFHVPDAAWIANRLAGYTKLVLWAVPTLPFLAIVGYQKIRLENSFLKLVGWSALSTLVGYLFILISQGHGWGFRYFHQVWWALPLLGTAAILSYQRQRSKAFTFIVMGIVLSLVLNNGLRLFQVETFIDRHLQQRPDVEQLEAELGEPFTGVVFLDTKSGYYRQDLVQNDPFLRDDVIYMVAKDHDSDSAFLQHWGLEATCLYSDGFNSAWRIPADQLDALRAGVPRDTLETDVPTLESSNVEEF